MAFPESAIARADAGALVPSFHNLHRIADTQYAAPARNQVLAEHHALRSASIGQQGAQRFAGGIELATLEIDGGERATSARLDHVELDSADTDALPVILRMGHGVRNDD